MDHQHNLKEISQVELALRKIRGLELPGSALEKFLQGTGGFQYTPSDLIELVESEPAFVISLLKLAKDENISLKEGEDVIRELIERLGLRKIRNVFLSEQVYPAHQRDGGVLRAQMSLFAITAACCSRKIAEQLEGFGIVPAKAYLAGLLSTVGNFALEQVVPRSFSRLVESAKTQNLELARLERENLGMDFAQVGKRVLEKFGVDDDIVMGVWLQQSTVLRKATDVPQAKLARLIVLARYTAVKTQIADFDIYSSGDLGGEIGKSLGIDETTLKEIAEGCVEEIKRRADSAGVYKLQKAGPDWQVFYEEVRRLSSSDAKLSQENSELRKSASSLDFVRELVSDLPSLDSVFDAAGKIAEGWKKFYQTGKVCVYALTGTENIPVVLIESANERIEKLVSTGEREDVIPKQDEAPEWLLGQLDPDFDRNFCRVVPLGSDGRISGVVLFELRHPGDWEKIRKEFEAGAFVAGRVLETAMKIQNQRDLVEWVLQSEQLPVPQQKETKPETEPEPAPETEEKPAPEPAGENLSSQQLSIGLEELAAGAAHELNNPLSVISGRAQLLLDSEKDEQKKQLLEKISDSSSQLSQIVAGLMSYA